MNAIELIADNIRKFGYHIYYVAGGVSPRFAYTIGLSERSGHELVFAGGALYRKDDVLGILRRLSGVRQDPTDTENLPSHEGFTLSNVDAHWSRELLRGAHDYYGKTANALQIVPSIGMRTIDTPDLSTWQPDKGPWRWLFEEWPFDVPRKSWAMVDLPLLKGKRAAQAARWEDDYWEVFSDPDAVDKDQSKPLPLGALVGFDPTLVAAVQLPVGGRIVRSESDEWQECG